MSRTKQILAAAFLALAAAGSVAATAGPAMASPAAATSHAVPGSFYHELRVVAAG